MEKDLAPGKYEIDGNNVFGIVQAYTTKPKGEEFEAHREYIDIQYIVSGEEQMKVADVSKMTASTEYDAGKDCGFFENAGDASVLMVQQGEYAIFFPQDIHMPGVSCNEVPSAVRKIVVKVKV